MGITNGYSFFALFAPWRLSESYEEDNSHIESRYDRSSWDDGWNNTEKELAIITARVLEPMSYLFMALRATVMQNTFPVIMLQSLLLLITWELSLRTKLNGNKF